MELVSPKTRIEARITMGTGAFCSAISGELIVASLPTKLHIPDAVPLKRVGNSCTTDK